MAKESKTDNNQLSLFDVLGLSENLGSDYSSKDIGDLIDKLNKVKHSAEKREEKERRRREKEGAERKAREERERKNAHIRKVTSMDLSLDWDALLDYCERSKDAYTKRTLDYIIFLIGTGCRIGEMMGLRWDDVDFENNVISINHQIIYARGEDGKNRFMASTPKTPLSNRKIPMFKEVRELLEREYEKQKLTGFCDTEIEGYTNFIFTSYKGYPVTGMSINKSFERLRTTYDKEEMVYRAERGEEFIEMPHFTAHCLRHTFATRLSENPDIVSIKAIQTLLGHSNIRTTMDIYSEAEDYHLAETVASMQARISL